MKKPDKLRSKFTALFPDLATDPNRLRLWVEEGGLQCSVGPAENLSYQISYKLVIIIEGWGTDSQGRKRSALEIFVALVDWLRIEQPELVSRAASPNAVFFEADHVTTEETDISITLPLTEAVKVIRREDGGFDMCVMDEPDPMFECDAPLAPLLEPAPLLQQIHAPGIAPEHLVRDPRPTPIE